MAATAFSRIAAMTNAQRDALVDQFGKASRLAAAEPVAVVGIGCRFPCDVVGPERYWTFLADGRDAVGEVPPDRWDADAYYDPDLAAPGRMASKWGGFLREIAEFDADFFGISPREAEAMDPQQRVLLEVAFEALEHAGIATDHLGGIRAAVLMGVYYTEYQGISAANPDAIDAYCATGNAHSITVGRIAYTLGLRGPAVAVDTACSSSLVSIHLACQSLRLRESDVALAGGVNLILRPETQLALSKWGMLSPRGRCRAFDAGADGFVRGEGAGVVVLKRLIDAVSDGDRVLAVVRGSAVNQDGRSNGLTAPNALAQQDVISRALQSADVTASSVNLIETHGTGTALGDPIEFDALAAVYGRGDGPCALGAVKTNFGHLEAAAGIAGFIKAVLALQRSRIPTNLHFTHWNPAIDPVPTRLFVPTETTAWPQCAGPRRAAVSSFGLGGTNAHVVLEQGPDPLSSSRDGESPAVTTLVVSGKTSERLASTAAMLADWIEGDGSSVALSAVAETLNHRARYAICATVCGRDRGEAVDGLRALAAGRSAPGVQERRGESRGPGIVFVYSGQGSQWAGMGRRLLADEPSFAAAVAELEPIFVAQCGFSLQHVLQAGEPIAGIDHIQPVLVGIHLALTQLWRSYGVQPDAVIGHSMGEVSAAIVSGALTVADGLRVIATRSRLMARLSGQGAMALLESDAPATEALIADHPDVALAVYASPRQTVIAGPPDEVDSLIAAVTAQNRLARRIDVDVASHHPTIDPILPELLGALADLDPVTPKIPLISATAPAGQPPAFDASYWVANVRNPVRFAQAVAVAAENHSTFIEISPHPLLTHALTEAIESVRPGGNGFVTGTLNRDDDETLTFHTQLVGVQTPTGSTGSRSRLADVPPTPWQHQRYWLANRPTGQMPTGAHLLLGMHVEMPSGHDHVWQADVGTDAVGWLADHRVHGQPVMPAAGFAEIALAAGSEALSLPPAGVAVTRLEVEQMLPLNGETRVTTQLTRSADDEIRIEIHSRSTGGHWCRHAVAQVEATQPSHRAVLANEEADPGTEVAVGDFYSALRRTGAQHGPAFAALTRIVRRDNGSAETEIALPDTATAHRGLRIHPVMLDAALQTLAAAMPAETLDASTEVTYLPVSIDRIQLLGAVGRRGRCRAELVSLDDDGAGKLGRITLMDASGTPTAEISGVYLRRVERRAVPLPLDQKIFDTGWLECPTPARNDVLPAGSWLLLHNDSDSEALADAFATRLGSPSMRVITEDLFDEAAVLEAFAKTASAPGLPPAGVVILVGGHLFDGTAAPDALQRTRELIWAISTTLRAVIGGWHGQSPRLWLVTRSGLAVTKDESGDPGIGALRGLVRVLAYEHPDLHTTLVDVGPADDAVATVTTELQSPAADDVIAWRGGRRYVERLRRAALSVAVHDPVVRRDGSYVVTGGLGGLGMVVARWLVDRGAGRVVLNGRTPPSDAQEADLADLRAHTEITFVAGDIASPGVAEQLVCTAEENGLPLRGVMHAAAVIEDALVATLNKESLGRVWAPKAEGALRLHEATAHRQLDWWAGFSSVASLLGSPGQGAYACANAWLDALVEWRRTSGLPAIALNWGQWSEVGVARSLRFGVLDPISPAEGVAALDSLLGSDLVRVGITRLRLDRAAAAFPEIRKLGYFAEMVEELDAIDSGGDWPGVDALRELTPDDVDRIVTERLRQRISAIMGYPDQSAIPGTKPLTEIGMDSLMAVRIRNTLRDDFGVEPAVALLLQGASLGDLANELTQQLGLGSHDDADRPNALRDRAHQRAAARQRAATRRKVGQRV
ncbi:polyketide synthase family protein [Mycobacterium sp. JS623]|uniref:type I polyketide synthase n=1 Tax=Mycobacterium sp. JS623 TaxID=212767 RepID=UPI0002A5624E|nr:type I polyketide synthase [Mycobacterium sp. JS623]AGB26046.1 polyketide synthase family protein [Mycobacterium sp. JS623]